MNQNYPLFLTNFVLIKQKIKKKHANLNHTCTNFTSDSSLQSNLNKICILLKTKPYFWLGEQINWCSWLVHGAKNQFFLSIGKEPFFSNAKLYRSISLRNPQKIKFWHNWPISCFDPPAQQIKTSKSRWRGVFGWKLFLFRFDCNTTSSLNVN